MPGSIIKRREWGARSPLCVTPLPWSQIDRIYIHYTASKADMGVSHDKCPQRNRGIQDFHLSPAAGGGEGPWCDIAYSFVFCKHGGKYEGRGWAVRTAANGTNDANNRGLAFVFLGADNENRDDVTQLGRQAMFELIREAERVKGKMLIVLPHSAAVGTECPGDELRAAILLRGWEHEKVVKRPALWWAWLAWYQGEGQFKTIGPRSLKHRPRGLPARIPASWWVWRTLFLAKRKK
jgi:hypothetical protein